MASLVSIINTALSHMGQPAITALTDAVKPAREANLIYEGVRDALLREHAWNFATKITALATVSGETVAGWAYVYSYPADCLFARKIYTSVDPTKKVEFREVQLSNGTRGIVSNQTGVVLEYTARVVDPTIFDSKFIDAYAWRLAADLALPIAGNKELREHLLRIYQMVLDDAKMLNAAEGYQAQTEATTYESARW